MGKRKQKARSQALAAYIAVRQAELAALDTTPILASYDPRCVTGRVSSPKSFRQVYQAGLNICQQFFRAVINAMFDRIVIPDIFVQGDISQNIEGGHRVFRGAQAYNRSRKNNALLRKHAGSQVVIQGGKRLEIVIHSSSPVVLHLTSQDEAVKSPPIFAANLGQPAGEPAGGTR